MKLVGYLSEPAIVRVQILILVYTGYLSKLITKSSLELYQKAQEDTVEVGKLLKSKIERPLPVDRSFESFLKSIECPFIYSRYQIVSTALLALMTCVIIAPIDWLTELLRLDHSLNCYIPSRFMFYGSMPVVMALVIYLLHLHWRFEKVYTSSYRMDLVTFLLHEKQDIERIYRIYKRENLEEELTTVDRYLLGIVCYQFKSGRRTLYRVRPNRTREARAELNRKVAHQTIVSYGILFSAILMFTPFVAYSILSDVFYLRDYPGCFPALEEQYKTVGPSPWSITLWVPKSIFNLFEFTWNVIVWVDSGITATLSIGFVYLINCDVLMYWRNLDQRLDSLVQRLRVKRSLELNIAHERCVGKKADTISTTQLRAHDFFCEEHIFEIVHLASDFFEQIRHADHYISSFLRTAVLLWLSHAAMLSYCNLTESPENLLSLRMLQVMAFTQLPIALNTLLLNHKTMETYRKICSLIALIGTKYKEDYLPLLGYYTERTWATYSLFNRPYRPTTLLSLIGWTYSCSIIVDNLTNDVMSSKNVAHRFIIGRH